MDPAYLYVHDLRSSGVVRAAIDLARRLAADRPTTLMAGYGEGFFAEQAARGPFRLVALAPAAGAFARAGAALRLRAWLARQPAGVLLSLGNMGHWTPWLAGPGLGHIRRVYVISNEVARGDGLKSTVRQAWMAALVRDAARVVLVGRTLAETPVFARALAAGRAVEIPNGVDLQLARARAAAPCPHRWLEDEVPVVLGVGRLRPQKNFDLLIEGVRRARATRRLRLVILGGGAREERARLEALAGDLGDDVLLAGETDNVFAWLSRASVFALPSRWEGSSLVLLEALAVGVPVVASRLAGDAAHVLDEGRYGALFDGRSPDALAQALLTQTGEAPVRPGDRAEAFSLAATNDAYAALVGELGERLDAGAGAAAALT
jgi:glycosyltransferase involved in cell wall biosynthesis